MPALPEARRRMRDVDADHRDLWAGWLALLVTGGLQLFLR